MWEKKVFLKKIFSFVSFETTCVAAHHHAVINLLLPLFSLVNRLRAISISTAGRGPTGDKRAAGNDAQENQSHFRNNLQS